MTRKRLPAKGTGLVWLAAGLLLAYPLALLVKTPLSTDSVWAYLFVAAASGGFGGLVHGMTRSPDTHYAIVVPFLDVRKELGFVGDILVGTAAAASILFVMDTLFGLKVDQLTQAHALLKFIGLGVISGYAGSAILDNLSVLISKRLVKSQEELVKAQVELAQQEMQKLKAQMQASSRATDLMALASAYMRWKLYDEALLLFDEAIKNDPNNANCYIRKSFVYAERAASLKSSAEKASLYDSAIQLTDTAIGVDPSSARAYYDRACYHQLKKEKGSKERILSDLKTAIEKNDYMKKMARYDPDLESLRNDPDFKKLVEAETPINHETKAAASGAR